MGLDKTTTLPDLAAIVAPLLGEPYATWNCFRLVKHLIYEGYGVTLDDEPQHAARSILEVWYRGDGADPLSLVQPWDAAIFACRGPFSDHLGLMVDAQYFVHTRPRTGVCLEPLRRLEKRLLQLARLRILL